MMDMNIALTGRGQLELVADIYEAVKSAMPGYFSLPDVRDFDAISKIYKDPHNSPSVGADPLTPPNIGGSKGVTATGELQRVTVLLRSKGEELRIHFGQLDRQAGNDDANIIVAVIDTPSMMAGKDCGLKEARDAVLYAAEKGNALLVIVPVKCEGYDERALLNKTASTFRETLELLRTKYRGKICVAVSVAESHRGADKVLRYVLAFMSGGLTGELQNVAYRFGYGSASDEGVLCGHELLTPTEHRPEAKPQPQQKSCAGKIIAAFLVGVVVAAAGFFIVGKTYTEEIVEVDSSAEIESIRQEAQAEIERLKASIQSAIRERDNSRREAETLKTEKDKAMEIANRYKQQVDTLTADNKKLTAEVNRLKEKDRKSIRLPNPFK